jgi:hypothetical protein
MLLGALGSLGTAHAAGTAAPADDSAALGTARALSARIYATTRDVEAVHAVRAAATPDLDHRIAALRHEIDALRRQAGDADVLAPSPLARKARQLSMLVANLERAARVPAATALPVLIPAHRPAIRQIAFAAPAPAAGGACATALGFGAGAELHGLLPSHGELWLRIDTSDDSALVVHTKASPLDTEIAEFGSCPTSSVATPDRSSDDAFGLAASLALTSHATKASHFLRVRNLGEAGDVSVIEETAGSIRGRVTDAASGSGLSAQLYAFNSLGIAAGQAYAFNDGNYELDLQPGSYYVAAMTNDHVAEAWPNAECAYAYDYSTCTQGQAQLITVHDGTATTGIDFALGLGARVAGHVRQAGTGIPISGAQVTLANSSGNALLYTWTDPVGRYLIPLLPAGTYYAEATTSSDRAQVFNHVDCPVPGQPSGCDPTIGTPIVVARNATENGIDFDMNPLPHLQVTVNLTDGAAPQYSVNIIVYDASHNILAWQNIAPGVPSSVGPLPPGSYYVTASLQGYFSQLFDHVECTSDCFSEFPLATPVVVTDGFTVPNLAFDLDPQATVSGRVTDATTGEGLANVQMQLWPTGATGSPVYSGTYTDGTYSFTGISPGSYWVVARSTDHRDTVYPDAPCSDYDYFDLSGCQLTQAQAVVVGHGGAVAGIDLALPLNASVSGTVDYRGPGSASFPITYANIHLVNASGSSVRYAYSNSDGTYRIQDITAGSYFIETVGTNYFGQIYDGIDCPAVGQECDATVGTPLVLAQGAEAVGIDFHVVGSRRLTGRVTDASTGAGIAGVIIDAWNGQTDEHCGAGATDTDGYYAINDEYSCSSSTRKASTDAGPGYFDQVYAGIVCPFGSAYAGLCSLDDATVIQFVDGQPVVMEVDFVLQPRVTIFENGFD